VALITGAAHRIGAAIAVDLAAAGWTVAVHYNRSQQAAAALCADIASRGGRAEAFAADLAREAESQALIGTVGGRLGAIGCLINNASVFEEDRVATATRASWDVHMETNLRAPFVLSQGFAAQLAGGGGGAIINILDQRVWNLTPYFLSYTVSKAALLALTRTMALALAPAIRVNAIGPGPTLPSPRQSAAQFARQSARMPLGRGTTPGEICDAVRFILAAPAMTGQMIALDGGQHLGWSFPGIAPGAEPGADPGTETE
jgi:NAD(P)-dependent dehydrogenase (short-subunit alcohol dehydrogenase family)